jgi:hypothetical protein
VLAVVIGFILIVAVAAGVVAVVAAPRLREGEEFLTPEGKRSLQRASQQARSQSATAADTTAQKASSLRARLTSVFAPLSQFLHHQFDRLEHRGTPAVQAPAPAPQVAGPGPEPQRGPHIARAVVRPVPDGQPRHVGQSSQAGARAEALAGAQAVPRLLPLDPADVDLRDDDLSDDEDDAVEPSSPAGTAAVGRPRAVPPESGPIPEVARAQRQPGPDVPAVIDLRTIEVGQAAPHPSPDVTTRRRT